MLSWRSGRKRKFTVREIIEAHMSFICLLEVGEPEKLETLFRPSLRLRMNGGDGLIHSVARG